MLITYFKIKKKNLQGALDNNLTFKFDNRSNLLLILKTST